MTRIEVYEAADPKQGMTLGELAAFVQDAMRRDIPGEAVVRVRVGFRSQVTRIETRS